MCMGILEALSPYLVTEYTTTWMIFTLSLEVALVGYGKPDGEWGWW